MLHPLLVLTSIPTELTIHTITIRATLLTPHPHSYPPKPPDPYGPSLPPPSQGLPAPHAKPSTSTTVTLTRRKHNPPQRYGRTVVCATWDVGLGSPWGRRLQGQGWKTGLRQGWGQFGRQWVADLVTDLDTELGSCRFRFSLPHPLGFGAGGWCTCVTPPQKKNTFSLFCCRSTGLRGRFRRSACPPNWIAR